MFNKDLPMYKQLAEDLKNKILGGEYEGGDRLPTIRENAQNNNVSLVTMMNAYQDLEKAGLVESKADGYVVNPSSSIYVREYYSKRIEELYSEIKECCEKIGEQPIDYLAKLDKILKGGKQ